MTVAPLIAMKSTKCESLEAVGKELDRRALEKEAKAEGKSTGAYARGILADGLMAIA